MYANSEQDLRMNTQVFDQKQSVEEVLRQTDIPKTETSDLRIYSYVAKQT